MCTAKRNCKARLVLYIRTLFNLEYFNVLEVTSFNPQYFKFTVTVPAQCQCNVNLRIKDTAIYKKLKVKLKLEHGGTSDRIVIGQGYNN